VIGRRSAAAIALATLLAVLSSCSSAATGNPLDVTNTNAYEAAIRWYIADLPQPTDTTNTGPLIMFVAPSSGKTIDAHTQAAVAKDLADMKDVVVVRFLDDRDDAVQLDVAGRPVKDRGVLLLVNSFSPHPPPLDLQVSVYRSEAETSNYELTITHTTAAAHPFTATATASTAVVPG